MKAFLATTLGLIAVGVLLIAFGLLAPRAAATSPNAPNETAHAADVNTGQLQLDCEPGQRASISEIAGRTSAVCIDILPAGRSVLYGPTRASLIERVSETGFRTYEPVQTRRPSRVSYVHRSPGRDWRRTALVIGGSTATGAGLGGIFGGKTGALIGAAVGGGASTLYEAARR